MLEAYEATFQARLILGVLFFGSLLAWDIARYGRAAPRLREYGFLLATMALAVVYGVAHDHVTATISPDYFLIGKGLAADPRPFRWAVTLLAAQATYGVGLLAGAAMLIANNPSKKSAPLPYARLARLCALPIGAAAIAAPIGAALFASQVIPALRTVAVEHATERGALRFLITWGMHAGSYAGALVGLVAAVVVVRRRRAAKAAPPQS